MRSSLHDLNLSAARADALFASTLQCSERPTAAQVRQAITAATRAFGDLGCAALVAQEYGDHPEAAVARMRWARTAVAGAFGVPSSEPPRAAGRTSYADGFPSPRLPGNLAGQRQAPLVLRAG